MKNNILVVTPLYKIINREDLIQDSECIHTLIKYWAKDYNVNVIFNYINGFSKIINILNIKKLNKLFNGYNYYCDDINVVICERQNLIPNQINGNFIDKFFNRRIIKKYNMFQDYKFIVFHLPSTSQFLIDTIKCNKKYAVLHQTDLQYLKKHPKFKKYLEKNFKKVFCRSLTIYKQIKKYNLKNLDYRIVSSGVNTIKMETEKKINKNKTKFLYVGKLIKRKNLDLLIKALSGLENEWELNVIGTGKMEQKYKELVYQLKLEKKVKFLGAKKHSDVLKEMEKSDIFCMPSVNETLGLVYLEAMSKGCITIGTINEGIDGIIKNNVNGFLVEPNIKSIQNCIQNIEKYSDKKLKEISKNAIKTALEYNELDMSKKYLSYLLEETK